MKTTKNRLFLLGSILLCLCMFTSCSKDDDETDYAPQLAGEYSGNYVDSSDLFGETSNNEPATVTVTGTNKVKITFTGKSKSFDMTIDPAASNANNIASGASDLSYSTSTMKLSLVAGSITYEATKKTTQQ